MDVAPQKDQFVRVRRALNHENGGVYSGAGSRSAAHIYIYVCISISIDLPHMLNVQHRELSQISLS
jgi:hypothetical protein